MGCYGLYVYVADDMFPVRRHFEEFFRKTPMAAISPGRMVDLLVEKAQESSDAVLFASLSTVPAKIGSLVALHVAKEKLNSGEISFTLSLDEMGWTRVWLPQGGGTRADFLVVSIDSAGDVLFQIIESKSEESGNKLSCDPNVEPYVEAIAQVNRTLKAIEDISTATTPTLDQDLRYTSLIEHLMAAAMASYDNLSDAQRAKAIDTINKLSRREANIRFEGMVVLTQAGINSPRETKNIDKGFTIVWSGNPDVEKTFGLSKGFALTTQATKSQENRGGPDAGSQDEQDEQPCGQEAPRPSAEPTSEGDEILAKEESQSADAGIVVSASQVGDMARAFIAASKMHSIPVTEAEPFTYRQDHRLSFSVCA